MGRLKIYYFLPALILIGLFLFTKHIGSKPEDILKEYEEDLITNEFMLFFVSTVIYFIIGLIIF